MCYVIKTNNRQLYRESSSKNNSMVFYDFSVVEKQPALLLLVCLLKLMT
jgi:hypothetical protein